MAWGRVRGDKQQHLMRAMWTAGGWEEGNGSPGIQNGVRSDQHSGAEGGALILGHTQSHTTAQKKETAPGW